MATVHPSLIAAQTLKVCGVRLLLNQQRCSAECLLSVGDSEGNLQKTASKSLSKIINQPPPKKSMTVIKMQISGHSIGQELELTRPTLTEMTEKNAKIEANDQRLLLREDLQNTRLTKDSMTSTTQN